MNNKKNSDKNSGEWQNVQLQAWGMENNET